jgi:hypothetical protein
MAWENSNFSKSYIAASAVSQYQPVAMVGAVSAASALDEAVMPAVASINYPLGIARASAAVGDPVTVDMAPGFAKAMARSSLGAGAWVGVIGATHSIGPLGQTGGSLIAIGMAEGSAAAGDVFTVRLVPADIV